MSSNASFINAAVTPSEATRLLAQAVAVGVLEFWPDDFSVTRGTIITELVRGHQLATDAYLLAIARQHGGKLVTPDSRVATLVPAGTPAEESLVVLR